MRNARVPGINCQRFIPADFGAPILPSRHGQSLPAQHEGCEMGANTQINDGPGALTRLRHELEGLKSNVALLRLLSKYESSQPRVPSGQPGAGQWASGAEGEGAAIGGNTRVAGQRITRAQEEFCERQYQRDTFHCNMVGSEPCHGQATLRYANCLNGLPIPPLNY
jgi:hypothetical protein